MLLPPWCEAAASSVERLPTEESRLQFVPIADGRLIDPPAEVDDPVVPQAGEVDQAAVDVFDLDTQANDLADPTADRLQQLLDPRLAVRCVVCVAVGPHRRGELVECLGFGFELPRL